MLIGLHFILMRLGENNELRDLSDCAPYRLIDGPGCTVVNRIWSKPPVYPMFISGTTFAKMFISLESFMSISLVYETHELQNSTAMLLAEAGYIVNQTFPRQSQWINSTRQQPPAILVIVVNNPDHTLLQQLLTFQEQPVCPVIVIGNRLMPRSANPSWKPVWIAA